MKSLRALTLAAGDFFRPRIFGVVLIGIAMTLVLFLALQAGIFYLIRWFAPETFSLPWVGEVSLGHPLSWGSLLLFPIMGFFLMAPVAAAFSGLFTDRVAETVEQDHYPQAIGHPLDFWDGFLESLAVVGLTLLVTIVTLILTPFIGPLAPVLFYGANGWLLGREFFQLAARRHLPDDRAQMLRQQLSGSVFVLGVLIALLLTVPLLNITIPVLATVAFTHLYHLSQKGGRDRRG